MSIIYDALKKVEDSSVKDLRPQDSGGKSLKHKFKPYLLYILAACAGFFIVNIFFVFLTNSKKVSGANTPVPSKISLAKAQAGKQQPPSSDPPVKMSSKGLLILNGIFFSGDEGYALVNNHILKEGDAVNGAIVKRITVDEVEVEVDGSVLKLTVARR